MEPITKKRTKAILIDSFVSGVVSYGAECILRKKIKNEAFHGLVLPIISQYALEYVQLKKSGQTVGYKMMGLQLVNEDGSELTGKQIAKRMLHRDTTSTMNYFRNRDNFEEQQGAILPHDRKFGTIVKETNLPN